MSTESKPMKLTCNGTVKRNAYILPSMYYYELRNTIVLYLFGNGEAVKHDFRVYWIDEDNDEIDIVNQSDYEIFLKACMDRLHLYAITKVNDGSNESQGTPKATFDGMFPTTSVHTHVECNNCMLKPLVGFRYKCVECHDYDLCQSCEAKHVHSEHMMVRMPHSNCPNLIEAWVTGRSKRSHKRSARIPVVVGAPEMASTTAPGGGDCERHNRRSHRRRDFHNGVFGHLYKMMVDLAEGGVQINDEAAANVANAAAESAAAAATAASTAATAATTAAVNVATTAARVAAEACANNSGAKATVSTEKKESKAEQTSNTGAKPKSAQSTPSAPSADNSEPNSIPVTPSLENLTQFIDPQYMRTGIEILSNFSEMFAKMLDPEDGVGMSCPFDSEARKNSTTSTTSTTSKPTATNVVEQSTNGSQTFVEKKTEKETPTSTTDSPNTQPNDSMKATLAERDRSQSLEDNDWQMIDQQTTTADKTPDEAPPAQSIDFAQLSKDLKAHIEDEQNRQEGLQLPEPVPIQTTNVATATAPEATKTSDAPVSYPMLSNEPQPSAPPKINEEKRGVLFYHSDPRINNAVHAMMAMGFSNEGAWLTQLLESVNGSIPDALDLMNAAQRNNK